VIPNSRFLRPILQTGPGYYYPVFSRYLRLALFLPSFAPPFCSKCSKLPMVKPIPSFQRHLFAPEIESRHKGTYWTFKMSNDRSSSAIEREREKPETTWNNHFFFRPNQCTHSLDYIINYIYITVTNPFRNLVNLLCLYLFLFDVRETGNSFECSRYIKVKGEDTIRHLHIVLLCPS
jgi:hypothetical protein